MAYVRCGSGGGTVEVITGSTTGTQGGNFTVTSQQSKAPKRLQVWREDGTLAFTFWNTQNSTKFLTSAYNNATTWTNVGSTYTYACSVKTIGSNSVTIAYPSNTSYSTGKTFYYSVEFE